jgi:hypothetical protein
MRAVPEMLVVAFAVVVVDVVDVTVVKVCEPPVVA